MVQNRVVPTRQEPQLPAHDGAPDEPAASTPSEEGAKGKGRGPWFPPAAMGTKAERVFLFFDDANATIGSKVVAILVMITIIVSTAAFVVESMPGHRARPAACRASGAPPTVEDCEPKSGAIFGLIEAVCIAIFTIDYVARMATVPFVRAALAGVKVRQGRDAPSGARVARKYATQALNIIDFLAIAPFYVELAIGGGGSQLAVIRVLRLARILRIFKMGKHNKGMQMLAKVLVMSAPAMYILAFFSIIAVVLFGALLYFTEGSSFSVDPQFTNATLAQAAGNRHFPLGVYARPDTSGHSQEATPVRSIAFAFWWVMTTMTTVGYGDISPTTSSGKLMGVLLFYVGIITIALPITILGMNFEKCYSEQQDVIEVQKAKDDKKLEAEKNRQAMSKAIRRSSMQTEDGTPWFPHHQSGLSRRIFVFFEDSSASRLGKLVSIFILLIIIASSATFVMETMPGNLVTPDTCDLLALSVADCTPTSKQIFKDMEFVFIMIFTVEYLGRLLTVHAATHLEAGLRNDRGGLRNTLAYLLVPLNVVDLVAILPWYVGLLTGSSGGGLAVLRVLRLARVFRIFKMGKYSSGALMVVRVVAESIPALSILFFMSMLFCVLFASCMYFAEGTNFSVAPRWLGDYPHGVYIRPTVDGYDEEPTPFRSIPFGFWWFFTTTTTVGYGDFYPTTTAGKFVGSIAFFAGIVLLALPITIIGGNFSRYYMDWVEESMHRDKEEKVVKAQQETVRESMRKSKIIIGS